jgi:ribosomal protein S18 acetylase RimI-like enzyme
MTVAVDFQVRSATPADQRQIADLLYNGQLIHRHLDWRHPLDWLGSAPFLMLERKGQLSAVLACPPDPPGVAWVRLFVDSGRYATEENWQALWKVALAELVREKILVAAVIVLQRWFIYPLLTTGFRTHQSIVMLERIDKIPLEMDATPGVLIREMALADLPAVAEVDALAFDLIWQNSLPAIEQAHRQSLLATVAEADGQVIGYQLSTRNPLGAHLARLAVRPAAQGRGLGRALVADLTQRTARQGITHITVNTQSDNRTSLALYARTGFRETGERFPVYQRQVS